MECLELSVCPCCFSVCVCVCVSVCPRAGKSNLVPTMTADHDDLIMIEESSERYRDHQPDSNDEHSENITGTPPTQYRTTEDGGYEIDPTAISSSPIEGFCAIRHLQGEEGREIDFHNQFPSRDSLAGRRAHSTRGQSKSTSYPSM